MTDAAGVPDDQVASPATGADRAGGIAPFAFLGLLAPAMVLYFVTSDFAVRAWLISLANLAGPVAVAAGILRWRPATARYWWVLVAGLALNGIGTSIDWLSWVFGPGVGVPSIADAFYLPGYALAFVSLFLLVHRHGGDGARYASIDSGILSTAVGITVWAFVIEPVLDAGGLDPAGMALTIAYPLLDVMMLGLGVTMFLLPGARPRAATFMIVALGCLFASDIAWTYQAATGTYIEATIVDAGWWINPMFWGAAALCPSMARLGDRPRLPSGPVTRWRVAALGLAATTAPLIIILQDPLGYESDVILIEIAAIALAWMVVLRLTGTLDALAWAHAKRTELQGVLSHQALHDPLTGLPNRTGLTKRLSAALASGTGHPAVLLLDLDDFKAVNDSHGLAVGDALLVHVAERLRRSLRERDVAAHLGGDEFVVLLDDCPGEAGASDIAARLLAGMAVPFDIDGRMLFVGASIGIALGDRHDLDPEDLLRDADIAMYLAKGQGKGRAEVYRPTMHASLLQRIALRADLQEAIANRQFVLQYQPIFTIPGGRLRGVEALVRWQHPSRGVLAPGEFIGLAEETGLIVPLGRWVLGQACRQLAEWRGRHEGAHDLSMAINVSAIQLHHPAFIDHLREALRESGVPPTSLVLELTESVLTDSESAVRVLTDLRAIGVGIAIDDFGTGYSSLSYVSRFPIDVLKIDRAFTSALGTASKEAALTATIIQLANTLGLTTIAEGIEEDSQLRALAALGCQMGQGFLLARPLQPALVDAMIGEAGTTAGVGRTGTRRRATPSARAGGFTQASSPRPVAVGAVGRGKGMRQ